MMALTTRFWDGRLISLFLFLKALISSSSQATLGLKNEAPRQYPTLSLQKKITRQLKLISKEYCISSEKNMNNYRLIF